MTVNKYLNAIDPQATPQSQPLIGREAEMTPNRAGGYGFTIDKWAQFQRFLVIGTEGGTYYVKGADDERAFTVENSRVALSCIAENGPRAVEMIVDISHGGKAPKNDQAVFALALAAKKGDSVTRRDAFLAVPAVCRTGTHVFQFAEAVDRLGGWGRGTRAALGKWYNDKEARSLAYQLIKYRQRGGWSHADVLRLAHPTPASSLHRALYAYAVDGADAFRAVMGELGTRVYSDAEAFIEAAIRLGATSSAKDAASLIREYRLPREAVPTPLLNEAEVWDALLDDMPMTALIRNLATLTRVGLIKPLSEHTKRVLVQLGDAERIRKARVHPMALLMALKTYESGKGLRGSTSWVPVQEICDALSAAFYLAYENVQPIGGGTLLALDVSSSMGSSVNGFTNLSCSEASAAMALITANTEAPGDYHIIGFTGSGWGRTAAGDAASQMKQLPISPKMRLSTSVDRVRNLTFGATNCAAPMLYALEHKLPVKLFVIYTDNETWVGDVHPSEALKRYRQRMGIPAKLVVCAMTSTGYSIADPTDGGMLDVVGLDATVPDVISDFGRS